jgi:hypothetical protein
VVKWYSPPSWEKKHDKTTLNNCHCYILSMSWQPSHNTTGYAPVTHDKTLTLFPTRLPVHQRMNANGTSTKLFISWNNNTMKYNSCNGYVTLLLIDAQWHLLCAWTFLEAVMGLSSLFSDILLRLLSSPVRTQLTLIVPIGGPGPPAPKVASPLLGSAQIPFPGSRTDISLTSKSRHPITIQVK